jgi:hypothetical protein
MRKLMLLGLLLGLVGCEKSSSSVSHTVVCFDNTYASVTYKIRTAGSVSVFTLRDYTFLSYRDIGTNELEHIDLFTNDCVID